METFQLAVKNENAEITIGTLVRGESIIGTLATVELIDQNSQKIQVTGIIEEVLEAEEFGSRADF